MRLLTTLIIAILALSATAQDTDALKRQIKRYEAEITRIDALIKKNSKQQATASENLKLANQKIANRNKIIANLDTQISTIEKQMGEEGRKTVLLSENLIKLRRKYSELTRLAYIQYLQSSTPAFIGSDSKFLQSSHAIINSARLTEGLKQGIRHIDSMQYSVKGQIERLTSEQKRLVELIDKRTGEINQLEQEKKQLSAMTNQLSGQNKDLNKKIATNRQKLQQLQKQIASAVSKESKSEPTKPIDKTLSSDFMKNMGKLPTPIKGGVIIDHFGIQNHPTQAGIKIENTGINIATAGGSDVTAVFSGEVRAIFSVAGMGNSIMVRHGQYLTVYSGLGNMVVKKGDKISTGQKIGTVDAELKILHFEIWKETTVLDPEKWLSI